MSLDWRGSSQAEVEAQAATSKRLRDDGRSAPLMEETAAMMSWTPMVYADGGLLDDGDELVGDGRQDVLDSLRQDR